MAEKRIDPRQIIFAGAKPKLICFCLERNEKFIPGEKCIFSMYTECLNCNGWMPDIKLRELRSVEIG